MPGLVSVSDVLVLGFPTLDCSVPVKSTKQMRVNPSISGAGYGILLHDEFGKGISKRRKHEVYTVSAGQS